MSLSPRWRLAVSIVLPAMIGLPGAYFAAIVFESYGWTLFLGLPVLISFLSSLVFRWTGASSLRATYGIALLSILLLLGLILAVAIEGVICIVMALPLIAPLAILGASMGYLIGKRLSPSLAGATPLLLVVSFPFLVAVESSQSPTPRLHEVTTRIEVLAPIQSVWDEVIAFDRIDEAPAGIFRLGIAYPIEARIEGHGVGAVRHCIFSTGPFVEPITRWDEPHVLEFDVTSNPLPMKEFSPWGALDAPHLHGTFTAERGRFQLYEQDGKTILEGTTWYRQTISPDFYWHRISDHLIHLIHLRVLEHIKQQAEHKYQGQTI